MDFDLHIDRDSGRYIKVKRAHVLYHCYDIRGNLLYVGMTLRPDTRWSEHRRQKSWWYRVRTIKLRHFNTKEELVKAERIAIEKLKPRFNYKETVAPCHGRNRKSPQAG